MKRFWCCRSLIVALAVAVVASSAWADTSGGKSAQTPAAKPAAKPVERPADDPFGAGPAKPNKKPDARPPAKPKGDSPIFVERKSGQSPAQPAAAAKCAPKPRGQAARQPVSPAPAPWPAKVAKLGAKKAIEEALASPTQIEFVETPLDDVIEYLKDLHGIEIQLDKKALEKVGVSVDSPITENLKGSSKSQVSTGHIGTTHTPITKNLKGISLRSALRLLLHPLDLTFIIDREVLLITTQEKADAHLTTVVYPVEDLVISKGKSGRLEADYDDLIEVITSTVKPAAWDSVGGPGSIAPFENRAALVVSHNRVVHEEIVQLLGLIRKARNVKPGAGPVALGLDEDAATVAIDKALASPTQMEFVETPLADVIDYLKDKHTIEIQLDKKAMEEIGVAPDTPININVKGISLRSALELILERLDVTYVVLDEVLLITTKEHAEKRLVTAVYPVADLVLPPGEADRGKADFDSLIDMLTSTIKPTTWDSVGGPGSIGAFSNGLLLIVSHTQEVHREMIQMLTDLRRLPAAKFVPPPPPKKKPPAPSRPAAKPTRS